MDLSTFAKVQLEQQLNKTQQLNIEIHTFKTYGIQLKFELVMPYTKFRQIVTSANAPSTYFKNQKLISDNISDNIK